jgi:hypothetical protein
MIRMSVRADLTAARRELRRIDVGLRARAVSAALNRTADQAKTAATRDITAAFNLKVRYVRSRIKILKAAPRSGRLEVTLSTPGKRSANLIRFAEVRASQKELRKRGKAGTLGVYVKVRRGGSYQLVKGAFIGNKGRTVFRRVGKARLPIEALTAIDVPQAMFSDVGITNLQRAVQRVFPQRLAHEIRRLLRGSA